MKQLSRFLICSLTILDCISVSGQGISLVKSIDTIKRATVAILAVDSAGNYVPIGSGVLIHPQVVLSAGHVNYNIMRWLYGKNCSETGYISFGINAFKDGKRIPFNWIKNVETHPDQANYRLSLMFPTPEHSFRFYADVGLIFLDNPVVDEIPFELPDTNILSRLNLNDHLIGAGYGYTKTITATKDSILKIVKLIDGVRRIWEPFKVSLINDLWFKAECDPDFNRPYVGMFDSGSPLLLNNSFVVGIRGTTDRGPDQCPYISCGTRIDNPKILKWIGDCERSRLGLKIK